MAKFKVGDVIAKDNIHHKVITKVTSFRYDYHLYKNGELKNPRHSYSINDIDYDHYLIAETSDMASSSPKVIDEPAKKKKSMIKKVILFPIHFIFSRVITTFLLGIATTIAAYTGYLPKLPSFTSTTSVVDYDYNNKLLTIEKSGVHKQYIMTPSALKSTGYIWLTYPNMELIESNYLDRVGRFIQFGKTGPSIKWPEEKQFSLTWN